jgi:hypothetical protein
MIQADKDKNIPQEITDFILSMIQAFLKTAYYMTEHPEEKGDKRIIRLFQKN